MTTPSGSDRGSAARSSRSAGRRFELEWLGGAAERLFRRRRPLADLPWDSLRLDDHPPALVDRARLSWTEGAFNEYCSAAAFADVQKALLECCAPVDLIGAAGTFVADEMLHVELNARVVTAMGGAPPVRVDLEALTPPPTPGLDALQRASDAVLRTCCVGEALSVPLLGAARAASREPLLGAVLERIVHDEGPHAALGWWYLEWAGARLDDAERARLSRVALDALAEVAGRWREPADERWSREQLEALGWLRPDEYQRLGRAAVVERVIEPLRRHGIVLPACEVEALFG